jgi:hypothetical protein
LDPFTLPLEDCASFVNSSFERIPCGVVEYDITWHDGNNEIDQCVNSVRTVVIDLLLSARESIVTYNYSL